MSPAALPEEFVSRAKDLLGTKGYIIDVADMEPFLKEERGLYRGATSFIARPADTSEVSAFVRLCNEFEVAIVPQGGNTGLVGGTVPRQGSSDVILNLGRLSEIFDVDLENSTMTVAAGAILQQIQAAADDADRFFPLSLASEGSCQIGGNLSTNAGGTAVLRFGNARDLVLGLEVVLPDGSIWDGLKGLRKDNTGYDLKHLFMGAEGTLGVITAAVLKLFPKPHQTETAFIGIADIKSGMAFLDVARNMAGDSLTAFEIVPELGIEFVTRHIPNAVDPLSERHPWYVLCELHAAHAGDDLKGVMEELLANALERDLIRDAVIAGSLDQQRALWQLRETLPEAQKSEGGSIKHDISVPISAVADFMREASNAVQEFVPGIRICAFGHLGDGNIHFNLSQPEGADTEAYLAMWDDVNEIVHGIAHALNGSISAEHGIGQLKREEITGRRVQEAASRKRVRQCRRGPLPGMHRVQRVVGGQIQGPQARPGDRGAQTDRRTLHRQDRHRRRRRHRHPQPGTRSLGHRLARPAPPGRGNHRHAAFSAGPVHRTARPIPGADRCRQ